MEKYFYALLMLGMLLIPVLLSYGSLGGKKDKEKEKEKDALPERPRRRFERKRMALGVRLFSGQVPYNGVTRDISEGGLFVSTDVPPPVGSTIELELMLPGGQRIRTPGMVRWSRPSFDSSPGCGISFEHMNAGARQAIQQLLNGGRLLTASA